MNSDEVKEGDKKMIIGSLESNPGLVNTERKNAVRSNDTSLTFQDVVSSLDGPVRNNIFANSN